MTRTENGFELGGCKVWLVVASGVAETGIAMAGMVEGELVKVDAGEGAGVFRLFFLASLE